MSGRVPITFEKITTDGRWILVNMVGNPEKIKIKTEAKPKEHISNIFKRFEPFYEEQTTIKITGTTNVKALSSIAKLEEIYMSAKNQIGSNEVLTIYIEDNIFDCYFDSFGYWREDDIPFINYRMSFTVKTSYNNKEEQNEKTT